MTQKAARWTLVVWLCLLTGPAHGRIGETLEQCVKRYGPVVTKNKGELGHLNYFFKQAGYTFLVRFHQGKVDNIHLEKTATNILDIHEPLSDDEIQIFLRANAGRTGFFGLPRQWQEVDLPSIMNKQWRTEDQSRCAIYDLLKNNMTIVTRKCSERFEARAKADAEHRLRGF